MTKPETKYVAVFNINREGHLVVRLVDLPPYTSLTDTAKENIVREVQSMLGDPIGGKGRVVAISNTLPSDYGAGGAYINKVTITPPMPAPVPPYQVKLTNSYVKILEDLGDDYF